MAFDLVGLPGLEPGTSSLSGKRSNRLSYNPIELQKQGQKLSYRTHEAGCAVSAGPGELAGREPASRAGTSFGLAEGHLHAAYQPRGQIVDDRAEGGDGRDQHDVDGAEQGRIAEHPGRGEPL